LSQHASCGLRLALRSTSAIRTVLAARDEREHQWVTAPILSEGTDLSMHSVDALAAVAATLNGRPRKTLGWRTPAEALDELMKSAHTAVATTG